MGPRVTLPVSSVRYRRLLCLFVLALVGLLALAGIASADTFTVNSTADVALSDSSGTSCLSTCTLREAVQAADNLGGSNTIDVPAGTYTMTIAASAPGDPSNGDLDVTAGDSLTITGAGASATIIDTNHIDRAFAVQSGASLSLSDVAIENGAQSDTSPSDNSTAAGYGAAIYNDGTLTVADSTLDHNVSYGDGAGIYAASDAVSTTITGSDVSYDESTDGYTGGVYIGGGDLSLSSTTVDDDAADDEGGGGVAWDSSGTGTITGATIDHDSGYYYGAGLADWSSGPLTVTDSDISDDAEQYYAGYSNGAGVYFDGSGALTIADSTISHDSAAYGGGIYLHGTGDVTLTSDTFAGDSAYDYYGGGVYDVNGASVSMTADTFTGNDAYYGGALYFDGYGEQLTDDTFSGNSAYYGGAVYLDTSGVSLLNDTIAHNDGVEGGGISYPASASSIQNTIVADNDGLPDTRDCYDGPAGGADLGNNLDSDGSCFSTGGDSTTAESAGDLVGVDPLLALPADNGGPVLTDALLPGSPAVGAANASACPSTDARGVAHAGGCDIGAFQTADADVAVTASGPATAQIGGPVTETFMVTDNGPAPATGVVLTDALPAGTSYFNSTSSQGGCSGTSTVTCDLGVLNSSQTGGATSVTVTITVIPSAAGSLTDSASVTSGTTDANSGNNTATVTTTVAAAATTAATATTTVYVRPLVITGAASQVRAKRATLSGIVNPAGESTGYRFQYGRTKRFGKETRLRRFAAGTSARGIKAVIRGLKPGSTYYFRVVAVNATGTSYGKTVRFKTGKAQKKHRKTKKK